MGSDTYDWVNRDALTMGHKALRYGGKIYQLWVSERGRGTSDFHQMIYLAELKNPWTVTGKILELVVPEYDWEKVGYGWSESDQLWYPAVVEGATPIYGDDGELYVLYAASGYWTTEYCIGQMKYIGGDLLEASSWAKSPTPIFRKNSEVNGVGGLYRVILPDGSGERMLYHGYLGSTTAGGRYSFLEGYTVDGDSVKIGEGTTYPAPLSTQFDIPLNGTPLFKKISGFDNWDGRFLIYDNVITIGKSFDKSDLPIPGIYGGGSYDAIAHGDISYSYTADGVNWIDGLPNQTGRYTVKAQLSGHYAFNKLGGSFELIIEEESLLKGGSVPSYIIGGSLALLLGGGGVLYATIRKSRAKKSVSRYEK